MNTAQLIPFTHPQFGEIRITDQEGAPWFVAADVCHILGHSNPTKALSNLESDERMTLTLSEGHSVGQRGGARSLNLVSESGLYCLIVRSRKSEARKFRKWVTSEVLPTIRKTGSYAMPGAKQSSPRGALRFPVKMIDIYSALRIEKPFLQWARFVCDAGFAEFEDYDIFGIDDIRVTYEMATHAALSADSPEGRALRRYFKALMKSGGSNIPAPATHDFTEFAQVVGTLVDELRLLRGEIRESKTLPVLVTTSPIRRKAPASKDPAAIAAEGIAQLTEGRQFAFELPFILVADTFATLRLGGLVPRGPGLRSREPKGSASFQSQAGKAIMKHVSGFSFPAHGIEWSVEHKSTSKGSVYEFTPVGEPNQ